MLQTIMQSVDTTEAVHRYNMTTNMSEDRVERDCFDRTKRCRRRCRMCGSERVCGRTFHAAASILLLLLVQTLTSSATIILNSGVAPTQPPPAAFPASACPSVCFCDETNYVNCVGDDSLWEVPVDLPRTVARLELRNYAIGTLAVQGALRELLDLHEVKLQQTKIAGIENGTFGNLTRLLRLDLSQNLMERITSAMFEGLTSLRYLDLSTNRVADMDEAFVDLVNLEQLNLRDNQLPCLTVKSFPGLYKIQYLNLDSNRIASVEVGTFQYLTGLAHLIVSNNPLTALSRLDFFGSRLQYIDVSRVGLQRVPQSLTRYVRDLRLAKNNLTHVRLGDFDSYPYISLLVLDDNRIEEIEGDALGRQEYLVRLWLNGNRLQRVPANLPPGLRVLYAEENLLRALPALSFQGLFNLEQLFLQRNLIERIDPCAFCDLLSLRHLNLQANLLESIVEGAFANLSSLISLDLSQNPIKMLSGGCFAGLDALRTLQLSRIKTFGRLEDTVFVPLKRLEKLEVYDSPTLANQMVNSTRALQSLRGLRELNLMHNNLATLRSDFPHFFPQLKIVKLNGNLWNCSNRDIRWLSAWINRTEIQFFHSYDIRCGEPAELLYKPLMMLRENDFKIVATTSKLANTLTVTNTTISVINGSLVPIPTVTVNTVTIPTTTDSPGIVIATPKTVSIEKENTNTTNLITKVAAQTVNFTSGLQLPVALAAQVANDSDVPFNSSSVNITSTSGLDFDISNVEGEYDEMDILVDWTPLPTTAMMATSETESTATYEATIPPVTSARTGISLPTAVPTQLKTDAFTTTAISKVTEMSALKENHSREYKNSSTILEDSTEMATSDVTTESPIANSTEVTARGHSVTTNTVEDSSTESPVSTTTEDDAILVPPPPQTESDAIHQNISATVATPPTPNNTIDMRRFEYEHHDGNDAHQLPVHVHTSNCTVSVTQATGDNSSMVAAGSVAAGVGLLLLGLTLSYLLFRWRRKYWPVALTSGSPSSYSFCSLSSNSTSGTGGGNGGGLSGLINRHMRRSNSSISYSPQRDEVSIVTVSEGTVGLRTLTHQGLSNKLYFVLENGADPAVADAVNKEALPDASLHELLPSPPPITVCGDGSQAGDPLLCPLYGHPQQSHHPPHQRKSSSRPRSTSTYCFTT